MCEFQYKFTDVYRVRVIFNSIPEKALTKCNIKEYIENEIVVNILGIAFCMPEDEWNAAEGRKWAFIDAIRHLYPHKRHSSTRKELQREYVKYEKKWADEIVVLKMADNIKY